MSNGFTWFAPLVAEGAAPRREMAHGMWWVDRSWVHHNHQRLPTLLLCF